MLDISSIVSEDVEGVRYYFQPKDLGLNKSIDKSNPPYAVKKNGRVQLYGAILTVRINMSIKSIPLLNLPIGFQAKKTGSSIGVTHSYIQPRGGDGVYMACLMNGISIHSAQIIVQPTNQAASYVLDGITYEVDF